MAMRIKLETISFLLKYANESFAICLYIVTIFFASPATSQTGFLSIDCGSTKDYIDDVTGLFWQSDAKYISTGTNLDDIYNAYPTSVIAGAKQFASVRYFDDPNDGHESDCYVLPTKPQQKYLIRLAFLLGNWTNSIGISLDDFNFDVYLNSTFIRTVADFFLRVTYSEIIFSSPGDIINVCLVRNKGRMSFISSIELRELGSEMYTNVSERLQGDTIYYLSIPFGRYDFGGQLRSFHRYPEDTYDRWWFTLSGPGINPTNPYAYADVNGSNMLPATRMLAPDLPPVAVMDTAIVSFNSNILNIPVSLGNEPTYITAFFQEVDAATPYVRGIDFLVNDHVKSSLNITKEVQEISFLIEDSNDTQTSITLSQAPWSPLPPMVNAMEFYKVKRFNPAQTARNDVDAVSALAKRLFGLQHREGDPCLPVPYFWLQCTVDDVEPTTSRVTGLLLDNFNISGSLPEEIFEFKNLSVLSLSQNNLTGSIQNLTKLPLLQKLSLRDNNLEGNIQNLSGLVYLQALYLEDNSLSGRIPSFLSSFSYLSELHLDNNFFSGGVPEKLSYKIGLNFTYSGNPSLRLKSSRSSKSDVGVVAGGLVGGAAGLIVLISLIWYLVTRKKRATSKIVKSIRNAGSLRYVQDEGDAIPSTQKADAGSGSYRFGSLPVFSLQQVSAATQKFCHKIGEGSVGPVYYGTLPGSGQEVAAKVKSGFSRQGLTEFKNELEVLSRVHHGNLVSLAGYCEEADQQVLIYTYLCNGSLRDHLSGKRSRGPLDWKMRLRIAVDSATGLEYLHFHCNPRIIHRDVKSANILLDKNMVAKVADFGISKPTLEGMTSGVDTRIMGTLGYIDPEYFISQRLTQKSDVYSFGVVLLEIISGRHPHMARLDDGTILSLVEWQSPVEVA